MASTRQKKWLESIKKNVARAACHRTSNETNIIDSRTNEEEEFIVPINPNTCAKKKLPLIVQEENNGSSGKRKPNSSLSPRENAAIRIQACFRGHLGRRAFQALRGMVKLQALARGVYVRKQAQDATKCMQALVRLQARMRARHLRLKSEGGGAIKFLEM